MIRVRNTTRDMDMGKKKTRRVGNYGPKIGRLSPTDLRSMSDRLGKIAARLADWGESLEDISGSVVVPRGTYDTAVKGLESWVVNQIGPAVEMEALRAGEESRASEAERRD